jgi:protein-tyrosine-phosphatase
VDLSSHTSTQLSTGDLSAADVVVTMTRQQLREVVLQLPDVWPHAFTLPELVRRGEEVGPRIPAHSVSDWVDHVHQGRQRRHMIGTVRGDDVSDPYGGPDAGYRRTANALAELMEGLGLLLWLSGPTDAWDG